MTLLNEHTSEGATDEADVGTGSGFGTPWTSVSKTGGCTIKYDAAQAMHGTRAIRLQRFVTTDSGYVRWVLGAGVARLQVRAYIYMTALPTQPMALYVFRNSSGTTMGQISLSVPSTPTDGKIWALNAAGAKLTGNLGSSTAAFPLSQWVRLEAAIKNGTTTSNGQIEWAYYLGDSGTAVQTFTSGTTENTGTVQPMELRFGLNGATTVPDTMWIDDPALGDGPTGWLGSTTIATPTAVVNGQVVHLIDATGSTVSSGTLTYSITPIGGAPTPTLVATGIWKVVPHATTTYVYDVTATGSLGGDDTVQYSVQPLSSGTAPVVRLRRAAGAFA